MNELEGRIKTSNRHNNRTKIVKSRIKLHNAQLNDDLAEIGVVTDKV
jgi:hypothetical protein